NSANSGGCRAVRILGRDIPERSSSSHHGCDTAPVSTWSCLCLLEGSTTFSGSELSIDVDSVNSYFSRAWRELDGRSDVCSVRNRHHPLSDRSHNCLRPLSDCFSYTQS